MLLDAWPEAAARPDSGRLPPAAMTPDELRAMRERTVIRGRRLPIVCGLYENQISPRVLPYLEQVDTVALWTWVAVDLAELEANLAKLEALVGPMPIILGCYMYDYGGTCPMPVELMRHQCELGLRWLREGRI